VATAGDLDVRVRAVAALTPHLTEIRADADQLSSLIAHTATLAEKVPTSVNAGMAPVSLPVVRIRIHLIRIRIQHFRLNTDLDPVSIRIHCLDDQKLEKIYS
jgi:hypothetical protein